MKQEAQQEAGRAGDKLQFEITEYKTSLEDESARALREHQREQDELVRREEDRLEREREIELKEYE
jgi:hypothetical protein